MIVNLLRVFAVFLTISSQTISAQSDRRPWTAQEVQKILQQRVGADKQCVGIVVGTVHAKGNQFVGCGGLRKDTESKVPDRDTVFEIGSVTKVFTTLLLADMVQRGEVKLDDPVSNFLPKQVSMPSRGTQKIRLVDLATHTSALPSMPDNFAPADGMNPFADYSVEQMHTALSSFKLTRDIGKKYEYSNLGMGLLGHVLSLQAKEDYESLVSSRITKPLGMDSTAITLSQDMRTRLGAGYTETQDEAKNWDLPTLAGAGALRSTAADMVIFLEACMGKITSPLTKAIEIQTQTRYPTGVPNLSIALGWHKLAINEGEICWHNGQTGGFHSFVGFDKEGGVGVVVLANTAADIDDIGLHLLNRQIPLRKVEPKKTRTAIQVDAKILDGHVGNFELAPTFVIAITREGDHLMLQATGQPKLELFAESEKEFFLKAVDAQITFVQDKEGKTKELVLHQAGAHQTATKRR